MASLALGSMLTGMMNTHQDNVMFDQSMVLQTQESTTSGMLSFIVFLCLFQQFFSFITAFQSCTISNFAKPYCLPSQKNE